MSPLSFRAVAPTPGATASTTGLDSVLLGLENFFTPLGDGRMSCSCSEQAINHEHLSLFPLTSRSSLYGVVGKSVLGRYLTVCYQSSLPIFSGIEFCGLWLMHRYKPIHAKLCSKRTKWRTNSWRAASSGIICCGNASERATPHFTDANCSPLPPPPPCASDAQKRCLSTALYASPSHLCAGPSWQFTSARETFT